ncbi:MAG: SNF2 helicase associated domain-containing protein [Chthoniobacterales bacterium]|nr:SNF2 helicase associated domain-containing protein [Chthoniobacterales bacterium]
MLVTEVELAGKRAMVSALAPNESYSCDTFDLAAVDALPQLAPMQMLTREEFLRLLVALRGHPRVTFGKATKVEIASTIHRPHATVRRGRGDSLDLQPQEPLLCAVGSCWVLRGNRFRPLAEGVPERFTIADVPRLRSWFEIEGELPHVEVATPQIAATIEGSLREVRVQLRARYGDAAYPLAARSPEVLSLPGAGGLRNLIAERAAMHRLEELGFAWRGEQLVLTNENRTARFFAFEYPRLQKEWQLQLSAQATKATAELEPLQPKIEVVGSGTDWFELQYSLGTPDGQAVSASELQRLLRSGQNRARLKNGRTAVFDTEAMTDFEEVLRDTDPQQVQPGRYRVPRAQAGYLAATAEELGSALQLATQPVNAPELGSLGEKLREYQREGVTWLWRQAQSGLGGILADEMGLGKTVQTLAFLRARKGAEPALIVCPSSLVTNWQNETQRFTPELQLLVLEGGDRHARFGEIGRADVVLTSYALLQRDAEKYQQVQFSTVVLDEAQQIKNPDTQNAQVAFSLRARTRFVLTGTPIENSVRDLWSLMNFAQPGYLGTRADFRERYELPISRGEAPEVQRRLARRMRPFLLRRKKTEVAKDLPEKLEQQVLVELTPAQRAAYDGLLREIQGGLSSERGNAGAVRMKMLVGLLRLRQVCCDLRLLKVAQASSLQSEEGTKLEAWATMSAKLELLDELLEEAIDGGHRVLLFSQFVSMLQLIRTRLEEKQIAFAYLDGQTKERQAVVDRFQADAAIPVFLMSLKAGGVGLNLSAADTVIHFDPWWNYAAEAQATDRAHRIGQTRVVTAYKLIARDTVEEKIVQLQARKRSTSEVMVGSEEPLMSGLTSEDLQELLS